MSSTSEGTLVTRHSTLPPSQFVGGARATDAHLADAALELPLTLEQHRHHAQRMAARHVVGRPARDRLLKRLRIAEKWLRETCAHLTRAARREGAVSAAGFTILKYAGLIEEHFAVARQELAPKHRLPLPQLAAGAVAGMPRIYDIARELITHSDSQLDAELVHEVVAAYQLRTTLLLRELNVLPAVLRLAVLEQFCRVASRVAHRQYEDEADAKTQVADTVSLRNGLNALRGLGAIDWCEFVERQSAADGVLRHDPLGIYPQMAPKSREYYRNAIQGLAQHSPLDEVQIAAAVVELAGVGRVSQDSTIRSSGRRGALAREGMKERHIGFFLVDRGRQILEERIGYRPGAWERITRAAARAPLACYLGAIAVTWSALIAIAVFSGIAAGLPSAGLAVSALLALLFAGAATETAVRIVNCITTMVVEPRPIVRLDFSKGVPDDCRTLVAVPTILGSPQAVHDLVAALEVRYLANQDDNLCFALVTDFPDADSETLPSDAAILNLARREIERLNVWHGTDDFGPFYLLHRPRTWNAQEQKFLGEERKRGKLGALNRLLRGDASGFCVTVGELDALASMRYVITLDTDTQLPPGAARDLIACMAHPLNRPRIDKRTRVVVEGHAILQPRVATTMPEARRSVFARLFAGDAGVDPYTSQTSDVYQDVFGEGSFIGKGIYDVDAVETAFHNRFPDNRVLSHDLIEGCFARSGLINDVELFEGFPARLPADMSRRHRWIRGDWQIAAWLGRHAPTAVGNAANPLSPLAKWKIFDNLRRSLTPPMLLAFILAAWLAAPALAGACLLLAVIVGLIPDLIPLVPGVFRKSTDTPWRLHLRNRLADLGKLLAREAVGWAMLPYTVSSNLDAIIRSLYRMHVSRQKLLEWTVSSEAEKNCVRDRRGYYRLLWASPLTGIAAAAWLGAAHPAALLAVGPLLLGWILAPSIAWRLSAARSSDSIRLHEGERQNFRRWARQTWHYFDTFVNEESNWLPPDNVQFDEPAVVAPRTSPTNIGLGMLADLSACDLGYLSVSRFIERTGHTFQTMLKLPMHRGHLYNWYDTQTLEPIGARYVSTVDSGNLRGALLVMQSALVELRDRPLVGPGFVDGFRDSLEVIVQRGIGCEAALEMTKYGAVQGARAALHFLDRIALSAHLAPRDEIRCADRDEPAVEWLSALQRQCAAARDELVQLAFWLDGDCGVNIISALKTLASANVSSELQQAARELLTSIESADRHANLRRLPEISEDISRQAGRLVDLVPQSAVDASSFDVLEDELGLLICRAAQSAAAAREQLAEVDALIEHCRAFSRMDFRFLYHPARKLLAVGYDAGEHRLDPCCYDLLASEARLASFLAVADGQLPLEHWSALGRGVAMHDGAPALVSWSGSMFEYLMPALVMPSYPTTFLDSSCRAAVSRQMSHARGHGLPWGVSESCYDQRNPDGAYSYRAFGVPGLRLERRTDQTIVVAPYASALAAMVAPRAACENLSRLQESGALSSYGFYDAIDFTDKTARPSACRSVMAHHSGMALVALANVLLGAPMRRRLMADPRLRAHDLLLQQRMPQTVRPVDWQRREVESVLLAGIEPSAPAVRAIDAPHIAPEQTHVLGDDDYQVELASVGGHDRCCYIRDVDSDRVWSNTFEPMRRQTQRHRAVFSPGRAEFRATSKSIDCRTLVAVSPEQGVEVRRIKLTNLSRDERTIELTTFAEVGHAAHVEPTSGGLLAWWPPRSMGEPTEWMFHLVRAVDADMAPAGFEMSRERFVGAGRTLASPEALDEPGELSGLPGVANDAILSLRQTLTLGPEQSVELDIITGTAAARDRALALLQRHRDPRLTWRVFEQAEAAAQF